MPFKHSYALNLTLHRPLPTFLHRLFPSFLRPIFIFKFFFSFLAPGIFVSTSFLCHSNLQPFLLHLPIHLFPSFISSSFITSPPSFPPPHLSNPHTLVIYLNPCIIIVNLKHSRVAILSLLSLNFYAVDFSYFTSFRLNF